GDKIASIQYSFGPLALLFIGTFLMLYGIFRFVVEFVRVPDEQLGYLFGSFITMGQLLSLPLVVLGIVVLVMAKRLDSPQVGRN
ncbi:prolipoprotein diacylglyceryl transferase family protein, partial [Lancefieldella parvula]|uniref:prolipoprotein diacylglyceryl transferase family protein n=1 Tax=Lancefieldella parvula TaxID=1382 RepID=UPI0036205C6A